MVNYVLVFCPCLLIGRTRYDFSDFISGKFSQFYPCTINITSSNWFLTVWNSLFLPSHELWLGTKTKLLPWWSSVELACLVIISYNQTETPLTTTFTIIVTRAEIFPQNLPSRSPSRRPLDRPVSPLGRVHTQGLRQRRFFSEKSMIFHLLFGWVFQLLRQNKKSFAAVTLNLLWFFIDFSLNFLWIFLLSVKGVVWTRPYLWFTGCAKENVPHLQPYHNLNNFWDTGM